MVAIAIYKGNLHHKKKTSNETQTQEWLMPVKDGCDEIENVGKLVAVMANDSIEANVDDQDLNQLPPEDNALSDKEERKKEIEEKLKILNERKHKLVQLLKQPPEDNTLSEKEERKKEIEEKLKILNERKHKLVQVLKILNAEEELRRRSNVQGITGRPIVSLQVDVTNDSGLMSRDVTPRPGSEGNCGGDVEGPDADGAPNQNLHSCNMTRISSMSPSSDSLYRRGPFSMFKLATSAVQKSEAESGYKNSLFQAAPAPLPPNLAGWMPNPPVHHLSASAGPIIGFGPLNDASMLKRGRTPPTNNPALEFRTADSEHAFKRTRAFGISDEVTVEQTRVLNVVFCSATALGSRLPSLDNARAKVAGAGAMLRPVSSSTQLFQAAPAPLPPNLAGWMPNPPVHHSSASAGPIIGFGPLNDASMLKCGRTPPTNNPALEFRTADSEHAFKRTRAFGISDELIKKVKPQVTKKTQQQEVKIVNVANTKNPSVSNRAKRSLIGDLSCSTQVHPQGFNKSGSFLGSRDLFAELDQLRSLLQESKDREAKLQGELLNEVEELVYLRWVNSCLKNELQNADLTSTPASAEWLNGSFSTDESSENGGSQKRLSLIKKMEKWPIVDEETSVSEPTNYKLNISWLEGRNPGRRHSISGVNCCPEDLVIKEDVETQGEFVNSLIREVLEHEISNYKDNYHIPCDLALKKMVSLSEKMERVVYNLLRTRDLLMRNCKEFHIPTDWMLDSGILNKVLQFGPLLHSTHRGFKRIKHFMNTLVLGSEPQDDGLDSRDHWKRVMQGHDGANLVPLVASNRIGKEVIETQHGKSAITFYDNSFIAGM
ncbi:Actin-binding FH2 [Artemisia annua]|uniref:Actin-binding FH2 n=1 Tax=Artemisia annua TaxID=35608 RepID=A0A2U1PIG6_ARTAN|nr:Actin-binding FH2 [Artemisia annua]